MSWRRLWRSGDPFIWLTGGGLALALLMVGALLGLILVNGLGFFWPTDVARLTLRDGTVIQGQVVEREVVPVEPGQPSAGHRIKVKQANRDVYGADFVWVDESAIATRDEPLDATILERREWGNACGTLVALRDAGKPVATGADATAAELARRLPDVQRTLDRLYGIERHEIGAVNRRQEALRLRLRGFELHGGGDAADRAAIGRELTEMKGRYDALERARRELRATLTAEVELAVVGAEAKRIPLQQVVRVVHPNRMGVFAKAWFYVTKFWEFVADDPRESNTEGGVFPAIFGTVLMVILMSLCVTPLGVLAALYLREYARQGLFVSIVRIAVNNLAGVPSIVFGVFGVGFFVYGVGKTIDRTFFSESLPTPTFGTGGILWASLTLALLTVPVVIVATEEGLATLPRSLREASLALGATKFETTWRVVLPAMTPSILTGMILAMARAAGEVAPLMLTGVVKLAPTLPLDGQAPFLHLDRKFMHLGFHIYDVGFQSPNVDAARPMVFATTLLLIAIVVVLNLTAIILRKRLRARVATSGV